MTRRTTQLSGYVILAAADTTFAARRMRRVRWLSKPALMPVLAAVAIAEETSPGAAQTDPLMLAGLGLSWLGDIALLGEGDGRFTVGLGSFLTAHFFYLLALRRRHKGVLRRRVWITGSYGLVWLILNAVLWNRTGSLRFPVLLYGTALSGMALAALDTGSPATAVGGAAFLLSDTILALDNFDVVRVPAADAIVMASYTAAQALIVLSQIRTENRHGGP